MRYHVPGRGIKEFAIDRLGKLETAFDTLYHALLADRRWFAVISASVGDFWEHRMYYYTGYFTYNAFLAMLALLVAAGAVLGFVIDLNPTFREQMTESFKSLVPIIGTTPETSAKVLATYRNIVGIFGLVGLVWTASRVFGALEWGFCQIWHCDKRKYLKKKVLGAALVSVLGLLFILTVLVQLGFSAFWGWVVGKHGALYSAGDLAGTLVVGFTVNFLMFFYVFMVVPTVKQSPRKCAAGALFCAPLFLGTQYTLTFYFGKISNIPSMYGGLSTVVVLIIWLHITGMLTFLGAEVVHVLSDEEAIERHRARATPFPKLFRSIGKNRDGGAGL